MITDFYVIASASNERQVNAIVDEVEGEDAARGVQARPPRRRCARAGGRCSTTSTSCAHIQHQDERDFYALDRLWRDCPVVAVDVDETP